MITLWKFLKIWNTVHSTWKLLHVSIFYKFSASFLFFYSSCPPGSWFPIHRPVESGSDPDPQHCPQQDQEMFNNIPLTDLYWTNSAPNMACYLKSIYCWKKIGPSWDKTYSTYSIPVFFPLLISTQCCCFEKACANFRLGTLCSTYLNLPLSKQRQTKQLLRFIALALLANPKNLPLYKKITSAIQQCVPYTTSMQTTRLNIGE